MTDSKNLLKLLQLLRLLNSPPAKDVHQLTRLMGLTKSTVYRYLKVLKKVGYEIDSNENNRKSLKFSVPKYGNGVLTATEINYLRGLLDAEHRKEVLAQNILGKFHRSLTLIDRKSVV